MKKSNIILLFNFLLVFTFAYAQDDKNTSFNIIAYGGIGFGVMENDNEPNYNLNSNSAEFLFNYNLNDYIGISTGVGLINLTGNGFNSVGNFYQERDLIKIPLVLTLNSKISEKFTLFTNFGFYGQTIIKDEFQYINNTQDNTYDGWNYGGQLGMGFVFKIFDNFSAGINYSGQSDFVKFETKNNQLINDKQKLKNLNAIGVIAMFDL
jgi:hypothetical protein